MQTYEQDVFCEQNRFIPQLMIITVISWVASPSDIFFCIYSEGNNFQFNYMIDLSPQLVSQNKVFQTPIF